MSDYRTDHYEDYRDEYPMHWPATQRRLENAAEWSKQFNDMVDENSWNQKLLGFSAQQGVENALRGIISAYNDPTIFRHDLNRIWNHYLENYHDHTDPQAQNCAKPSTTCSNTPHTRTRTLPLATATGSSTTQPNTATTATLAPWTKTKRWN